MRIRRWHKSALILVLLAGCVQPDAVHVERGAVTLIDGNSQPFKDAVKAAVLSPEITAALSSHIETTIMPKLTAKAEATIDRHVAQATRDNTQGGGGWNFNNISIEGGATLTLALLVAWIIRWLSKKSGQGVKILTRRKRPRPVTGAPGIPK